MKIECADYAAVTGPSQGRVDKNFIPVISVTYGTFRLD
jgi:hypothetical protein